MSTDPTTSPQRVRALFNPRSIALVGATDKSRWSWNTFTNLATFDGEVYCVNPRASTVHGVPAHSSLQEIGEPVDLAYIMVPTHAVLDTLKEAAACGIRNVVVLTAGFGETGAEGRQLQHEIAEFACEADLTLVGPNGNGFVNATTSTAPYGLPITEPLLPGGIGIVLQSGALASAILTLTQARNLGISQLVSMGNEAALSMSDAIEHLVEDDDTKVIALFIEAIRDPEEFSRVARRAHEKGKPIVALKVGRSEISARAAMAHTGALVGDHRVVDTAFRQLGIIRVDSLEELIVTAGLLERTGELPGGRAVFVTPSGGACDIIADRAEDEGIELPEFSADSVSGLVEIVPPYASVHNPLDVTGYVVVDPTLLPEALRIAVHDPSVDFAVCLVQVPRSEPPRVESAVTMFSGLTEVAEGAPCPVLFMSQTAVDITDYGREFSDRTGFPAPLASIELGLRALGHAVRWSRARRVRAQRQVRGSQSAPAAVFPGDAAGTWSEKRALDLLAEHGVPVVPNELVRSADQAAEAAERLGHPVVVKLASSDVAHKSDIGGVRLGLRSADEVRGAFDEVTAAARGIQPVPRVDGAIVAPMRSGGIELLVGVVRDPLWGPVIAVRLGGVWVEVFADSAARLLPVDEQDVRDMLGELKGAALLTGGRGRERVDLDAVAEVVVRVARLAHSLGERLESLEINPLLVDGSRVEALDALLCWQD